MDRTLDLGKLMLVKIAEGKWVNPEHVTDIGDCTFPPDKVGCVVDLLKGSVLVEKSADEVAKLLNESEQL